MKKLKLPILIILITLLIPAISHTTTVAESINNKTVSNDIKSDKTTLIQKKLKNAFLLHLKPQKLSLKAKGYKEVKNGIYFKWLYLDVVGGVIDGLRIDEFEAKALGITFNKADQWEQKLRILSTDKVALKLKVLEKDINDLFKRKYGKNKSGWLKIGFDFKPGFLYTKGLYKFPYLPIKILVELEGKLKVVNGTKVYLYDYKMYVDKTKVSQKTADRLISKIQPLLDLNKLMFPTKLSDIIITDDSIIIKTKPIKEVP